jgi:SAM-dependent methyltransferase
MNPDSQDFQFLASSALEARRLGVLNFSHLDQPIGQWNYIRIANQIAARQSPCRILDWGCGFGQMTWLLRRRGFEVSPFEVGEPDPRIPPMQLTRDLSPTRTLHPTALPFADASFDAVLGCGVLEHVDEFSKPGNELLSLQEIHRVLKPGGVFFIFQLPQKCSWQESLIRRLKLGYAHPRRYTQSEIRAMLKAQGFRVEQVRRMNLLPKNLTSMPGIVRTIYSSCARPLISVDRALCRVPLLNRIAGVMEIVAVRE